MTLIIAQRLTRRLCIFCKKPIEIPKETLLQEGFQEDQIKDLVLYEPQGCDRCTNGYKGRIGLYEILNMSESIGQIIMSGGSSLDIAEQAKKEGMVTLRQSGRIRVIEGVTSLDEISRVTSD